MTRLHRLALLIAATAVTPAACDRLGPLEPIHPEEVQITLDVSGGLVGRAYAFRIDGASLEVRGVSCQAFCDWEAGELLTPISAAQVADLAQRLEYAGALRLGGDYGTECCDQIAYTLRYTRGEETVEISGTEGRLPDTLAAAVSHLAGLALGGMPILVDPTGVGGDWEGDGFAIDSVTVEGRTLTAHVTYGGGCGLHRFDLVAWGPWLESDPVQIEALLSHDAGTDTCEALVTDTRRFDLGPLAEAWRAAYGPSSGPIRIMLRLDDPTPGTPATRLVELTL